MVCLIFLLAVNIFGTLHTWGHFFDTLGILGAHSGTSEPSGIINHRGRALRGDSKTKQRCQKHKLLSAVFCSSSLHSPRDVNRLGWCFQALPAYLTQKNKCLDSYCMDWDCNVSSAVTPHSTSIQTHADQRPPKTAMFFKVFIGQSTIQGPQTILPTSVELKFNRDFGIISPWCLLRRGGDTSTRTWKPWWGWWRRWA